MNDESMNITSKEEIQQALKSYPKELEGVNVYLAPYGKESYGGEKEGKKIIILAKRDYEDKSNLHSILHHELAHIESEHYQERSQTKHKMLTETEIRQEIEAVKLSEGMITPARIADIAVGIANQKRLSPMSVIQKTLLVARQEGIDEQVVAKAKIILLRRLRNK